MNLPSLSAFIAAYNEIGGLAMVVREIDSTLRDLGREYEIVIIDDGSVDGTGILADQLGREFGSVRVIHHGKNQGLGGVYRTGFACAQGDLVTFFPADGQFPAIIIKQFVSLIDNVDMVLGYLPHRNCSLLAKSLSMAERILFRLLFGPLPKFQGVLMFKRTLLKELRLESSGRGWTVLMELIVRASRKGYRLVSVPTEMRPRISGRSKVNNIPTIWANLKQMFTLRHYL